MSTGKTYTRTKKPIGIGIQDLLTGQSQRRPSNLNIGGNPTPEGNGKLLQRQRSSEGIKALKIKALQDQKNKAKMNHDRWKANSKHSKMNLTTNSQEKDSIISSSQKSSTFLRTSPKARNSKRMQLLNSPTSSKKKAISSSNNLYAQTSIRRKAGSKKNTLLACNTSPNKSSISSIAHMISSRNKSKTSISKFQLNLSSDNPLNKNKNKDAE